MGLSDFFGFRALANPGEFQLPDVFPLSMELEFFVDIDVMNVYSRILTDCVDRTQNIPQEIFPLLWDNCLQSESNEGLITMLAKAMTCKRDIFLIYDPALIMVREATTSEAMQIKEEYLTLGASDLGIYVSFRKYRRTDMIRLYSAMEYCVVSSMNKMVNLSKAIQFKMNDMRGAVSLTDSSVAIEQAKTMAKALGHGRDILLDKNDDILTATPDISSIEKSIAFLDAKKSFYFAMPLSYITGEQTAGIGSTGEADSRAVERGLKQYYISVLKPVIENLFDIQTSFKSTDFRQINSALEALKTFQLVDDTLLAQTDKQFIIQKLFDIAPEGE